MSAAADPCFFFLMMESGSGFYKSNSILDLYHYDTDPILSLTDIDSDVACGV